MKSKKVAITLLYLGGLFFGAGFFYAYLYKNSISNLIKLSPGTSSIEPYTFYIALAVIWVFLAILLILFNKYQNKKEGNEDDEDNGDEE